MTILKYDNLPFNAKLNTIFKKVLAKLCTRRKSMISTNEWNRAQTRIADLESKLEQAELKVAELERDLQLLTHEPEVTNIESNNEPSKTNEIPF